jgi:HEPN domain-containing protein
MPDSQYDKARDLTEEALKKAAKGDERAAAQLMNQAMASDEKAVEDVLRDLDDDVGAKHDPQEIAEALSSEAEKNTPKGG